jgi:hypothetical protein
MSMYKRITKEFNAKYDWYSLKAQKSLSKLTYESGGEATRFRNLGRCEGLATLSATFREKPPVPTG